MLCLLVAVALSSGQFALDRFDGHIEHNPPDARVAVIVDTLLEQNRLGDVRNLVALGDIKTRRSAATEVLFSERHDALPIVLLLADETDEQLRDIAFDAVTRYPLECWPILLQMARGGSAGAANLIGRYVNLRDKVATELADSPHAVIRAWSLNYMPDAVAEKRLNDPSIEVCRVAIGKLSMASLERRDALLYDKRTRVRILAAEREFYGHTEEDIAKWARVARDPDPTVRYWALHHFVSMGRSKTTSRDRLAAIAAVERNLSMGPAVVRRAATYAVRGWLLEWEATEKSWGAREINAVKRMLKTKALRDELYKQATTEKTSTSHGMVGNAAVAHAAESLAMSGDSRAANVLLELIRTKKQPDHYYLVKWFAHIPKKAAAKPLLTLVDVGIGKRRLENVETSLQADNLLGHSLEALRPHMDRPIIDRLLKMMRDQSIMEHRRMTIMHALTLTRDARVGNEIAKLALDNGVENSVRFTAINKLADSGTPSARAVLKQLRSDNNEDIRATAKWALSKSKN